MVDALGHVDPYLPCGWERIVAEGERSAVHVTYLSFPAGFPTVRIWGVRAWYLAFSIHPIDRSHTSLLSMVCRSLLWRRDTLLLSKGTTPAPGTELGYCWRLLRPRLQSYARSPPAYRRLGHTFDQP